MSAFPAALSHCWHPVAYGRDVLDVPVSSILLDEPLVLWRDESGSVVAMRDLCIHRGTALSLGWLANGCIVCPYHGWNYDPSGACVAIPQLDKPGIPAKARVEAFSSVERYGLVWVALGEPTHDLPDVPELESEDWRVVNTGPFPWDADASRQVENFTDFGHFP